MNDPKNIVICSDDTGNTAIKGRGTNIFKLFEAVDMGTRRGVADINAVVNELSSAENGTVVFASSTGKQYSLEDEKWGNGAFTKALVEGLSGKVDLLGKGKITVNMLDAWLAERVKELTGGKQTPTTTKPATVPDFPLAVRK